MAHDVFISHASQDKPIADSACAALERNGIRCWIAPRDVQPGRSFAGEITRAIEASKAMVLIFSAHTNNSEQVLREVQLAVNAHLHVLQFRIEEVSANDDLKYYLSTPHWLDAQTPPLKAHLDRLVKAIKALLPAAGESSPVPQTNISSPVPQSTTPSSPSFSGPTRRSSMKPIMVAAIGGIVICAALATTVMWYLSHGHQWTTTASVTEAAPVSPTATPQAVVHAAPSASAEITRGLAPTPNAAVGEGASSATPRSASAPAETLHTELPPSTYPVASPMARNPPAAVRNPTPLVRNSKEAIPHFESGSTRLKKGDLDGALTDFDQGLELDPGDAKAYVFRGTVKNKRGDLEGALVDYNKAIEFGAPSVAALAHAGLGDVYRGQEKYQAAIGEYNRAINITPQSAAIYSSRGIAKLLQGDTHGALEDHSKAVELEPRSASALENLAGFYVQTRRWTEALTTIRKAIDIDPAHQTYGNVLIWVVESHRDATTADRDLGEYLIKSGPRKSDDWTGFIADFLVGKVSAKDFMDSKNSFVGSNRRRRCQTWYF